MYRKNTSKMTSLLGGTRGRPGPEARPLGKANGPGTYSRRIPPTLMDMIPSSRPGITFAVSGSPVTRMSCGLVAVVSWNTKSWPLPSFTSATKSATTCTPGKGAGPFPTTISLYCRPDFVVTIVADSSAFMQPASQRGDSTGKGIPAPTARAGLASTPRRPASVTDNAVCVRKARRSTSGLVSSSTRAPVFFVTERAEARATTLRAGCARCVVLERPCDCDATPFSAMREEKADTVVAIAYRCTVKMYKRDG
mmetsp:Transcript_33381/g.56041  ORF Transcript_33381/g.56041 Transcript_33381/m.56041 type:complete len:252 (+) Transcript_33381:258-1013(+)